MNTMEKRERTITEWWTVHFIAWSCYFQRDKCEVVWHIQYGWTTLTTMICCSSLDSEFELLDGVTPLTIDDLVFSPNYTRFNQDDHRWDWCLFVWTKMIHDQSESFILQKMQTGSKDKKHKSKERSYSHKKDKKSFATNINFQRGGGRSQLWPHG